MRKTFVSNLLLLVAVNLLVKPFYILGIETEIQNRTGQEVFGSYFALINFSFLLNIIPDMGITNWNTRNIASKPTLLATHFPMLLSLRALLSMAYLLIIAVCSVSFGYTKAQIGILMLLAFNQVLVSIIQYLRSNLAGLHLFRQDSLISVLDRTILVLIMALALWMPRFANRPFHIEWLVWGQTLSYGITLIVAFVLVMRRTGGLRLDWNPSFIRTALKESFPFALLILVSQIVLRADTVILERLNGAASAGNYAMGFRFFDALTMISFLFAGLLLPMFSRMWSNKEPLSSLLGLSLRLMAAGAWMTLTAAICWRSEILHLFYDNPQPEAIESFAYLMIGFAAFSLQYIFGTLLTAIGKLKAMVTIALAGLAVNLILNLILIPRYGAVGAGMAHVAAQSAMLALQMIVVHRHTEVSLREDYVRLIVFAAGSIAILFGVVHFSTDTISRSTFAYDAALYLSLAVILAVLTRVLDARAFIRLLSQRD